MKRKLGKRLGAGLLSAVLLTNTALPVWASTRGETPSTIPQVENIRTKSTDEYTEEQIKDSLVEFGEVEFLVSQNNSTVKSNTHSYIDLLNTYEMLEELGGLASPEGGTTASITREDVKNAYLQYEEAKMNMIKSAQGMYPSYYQLTYSLEQLEANLKVAEMSYQGTLVQKEYGLCTDKDVSDALSNIANIKSNIANVENQIVVLKQEFCKLIGKGFNEEVEFGEVPEIDYEYIAAIDRNADIDMAAEYSYQVRIKENAMENYGPSSTPDTRSSDWYARLAAHEDASAAANEAYLNIMTQKAALELAEEKLANAELLMKQAEEKYNLGMISKLEYEQQKASYVTEECNYKTEKMKLFGTVNTYEWCLLGI